MLSILDESHDFVSHCIISDIPVTLSIDYVWCMRHEVNQWPLTYWKGIIGIVVANNRLEIIIEHVDTLVDATYGLRIAINEVTLHKIVHITLVELHLDIIDSKMLCKITEQATVFVVKQYGNHHALNSVQSQTLAQKLHILLHAVKHFFLKRAVFELVENVYKWSY